jgi:S1-C subfamily serine protease
MKTLLTFLAAAVLGCLSLIGAPALAAPPAPVEKTALPPDLLPLKGADLYSHTLQGVALVIAPDGSRGTGWIVDQKRRLLFTNCHVVASAKKVDDLMVLVFPEYKDGDVIAERDHYLKDLKKRAIRGKVVFSDPDRDLALIEAESLPETAQALQLAEKSVRAGDEVSSIGNPGVSKGLWVYNKGVVRSVYENGESLNGGAGSVRIVETQNPLNPGDSGGPMVNAGGEVVAINAAISRAGSLVSLGIDASEMKAVLDEFANPAAAAKTAAIAVARGNAAKAAKQYDKAIEEYTAALEIDPKCLDALKGRAWVYNETRLFADAVADCDAVLKIAPNDLAALRERIYASQHLKKFARVVLDCDHFLKIQPNDVRALFARGQAYEELGFLDKAEADYAGAFLNAGPGSDLGVKALAKVKEIEEIQRTEGFPTGK